jgi:hypothetical protein
MTSQSYFIISGALTTELNDLHGATFPNSDNQEATRAIRIKEVEQAQRELDAVYCNNFPPCKAATEQQSTIAAINELDKLDELRHIYSYMRSDRRHKINRTN